MLEGRPPCVDRAVDSACAHTANRFTGRPTIHIVSGFGIAAASRQNRRRLPLFYSVAIIFPITQNLVIYAMSGSAMPFFSAFHTMWSEAKPHRLGGDHRAMPTPTGNVAGVKRHLLRLPIKIPQSTATKNLWLIRRRCRDAQNGE